MLFRVRQGAMIGEKQGENHLASDSKPVKSGNKAA
jgi:hypothetical protein